MPIKRGNKWQGSVGSKEGRVRVLFSSEADATKWEKVQAARVVADLPVERPNGLTGSSPAPVGRKQKYSTLGELVDLASMGWRKKKAPWERALRAKQLMDFYGRDKSIIDLLDEEEQARLHEPLHTTWSSWQGRQVTFLQTKTTTQRTVPTTERLCGIIARRRETLRNQLGPISVGPALVRWLSRAPLTSHTRALPVSRQT